MDTPLLLKAVSQDALVFLVSFIAVSAISWWPGNVIIRMAYSYVLDIASSPEPTQSLKEWLQHKALRKEMADFRSDISAIIGRTERVAYIAAVMFALPRLLTGVIIFKAFFGWAQVKDTPQTPDTQPAHLATLAHYHTYVLGNLMSLLMGTALGLVGLYWVPRWLALAGVPCKVLCFGGG